MSQAKDLTRSLLNTMTSLNSLSLANTPRPAPVQGSTVAPFPSSGSLMSPMGAQISNGFSTPMSFQTGGMGMVMRPPGPTHYGGMATTNSTPNFGAFTQHQGPNKTSDMSALDSLFKPSPPKVSLNQMGPKAPTGTNNTWLQPFGGTQNAPTQLQGTSAPLGGVAGGFGMQGNPFFSPHNFSQPAAAASLNQSGAKHASSVSSDLKDLFGW